MATFSALSRPARVLVVGTLGAGILLAIWLSVRTSYESYSVLFRDLERDDSAALVMKLKEMKVPYKLGTDGTSVEVPEARVHELRLELASAGLPRGGMVGFESFDKVHLGATEFEQRVLYRRALEGELARTISTVTAVQSARVHLVLPEKSVFATRQEPASASVVLKVKPGRGLGAQEVTAMVNLVSSSVPGLTPDRVSMVSTEGAVLHKPRRNANGVAGVGSTGGGGDDEEIPPARALETTLEERVRAMLERVVGAGHADVRVSADIDLTRIERTEDRYDPAKTALRSEEASVEHAAGDNNNSVAGVPGAESNLPTGAAPVASSDSATAGPNGLVRQSHTRNFEVDHVNEKRVSMGGTVRRLTVAVVLDGVPKPEDKNVMVPRSREELAVLTGLVRNAVGASDTRGDSITVESVPFNEADRFEVAPVAEESKLARLTKRVPLPVYGGVGALTLLALIFFVARSSRSKKQVASDERWAKALPPPDGYAAGQLAGGSTVAALPQPDEREEAHARAGTDPATAALVIRHWLGASEEEAATQTARAS